MSSVEAMTTIHLSTAFRRKDMQRAVADSGAGVILVPDGDRALLRLLTPNSWRWARSTQVVLLVMRVRAQSNGSAVLGLVMSEVKRLCRRFGRTVLGLNVLELVSVATSVVGDHEVVDPVSLSIDDHASKRVVEELGLVGDVYWFAVLGAITPRKNVPLIVDALCRASLDSAGILFAGRLSPDLEMEMPALIRRLDAAGIHHRECNKTLEDLDFDAVVRRVDCIVLAHSNEGSSGILGKASVAGTRLVCSGAQTLKEDIRNLPEMGEWVELVEPDLAGALSRARSARRPAPRAASGPREFAAKFF
jgi:hypothetical protein